MYMCTVYHIIKNPVKLLKAAGSLFWRKLMGFSTEKTSLLELLALHEEAKHSNGFHSKQENHRHTTNRLKLSMTSFIMFVAFLIYNICFLEKKQNLKTPHTCNNISPHWTSLPPTPLPKSEDWSPRSTLNKYGLVKSSTCLQPTTFHRNPVKQMKAVWNPLAHGCLNDFGYCNILTV